jgi:hypothetical protein
MSWHLRLDCRSIEYPVSIIIMHVHEAECSNSLQSELGVKGGWWDQCQTSPYLSASARTEEEVGLISAELAHDPNTGRVHSNVSSLVQR